MVRPVQLFSMGEDESHTGTEAGLNEDHLFSYSDDENGSLSDAYFFPATNANNQHPETPPKARQNITGRLEFSDDEEETIRDRVIQKVGTLLAVSEDQQNQGDVAPSPFDSNTPLLPTQISYGSNDANKRDRPDLYASADSLAMSDDGSLDYSPRRPQKHFNPHKTHLARLNEKDHRLYRKIQQKQRNQIAREQVVKEIRGTQQSLSCRDSVFAIMFVLQLVAIAFTAIRFGPGVVMLPDPFGGNISSTFQEDDVPTDDETVIELLTPLFTIDYQNVIALCGVTGFFACILSIFTVGLMLIIAKWLIQTVLVFSVVLLFACGVAGLFLGSESFIPFLGFVALILTIGYTRFVWDHIPFAATNLKTAIFAMRCTADITAVGIGMVLLAFLWCWVWCTAFIGVVDTLNTADCTTNNVYDNAQCYYTANKHYALVYGFLFFSFYWTTMVIKNIVQVTVASAVGTWWFHPEEIQPYFCKAVHRPFFRCFTTSLGPICLGSLILSPCQFIGTISSILCRLCGCASEMNDGSEDGFFVPYHHFSRWCNRWAFTYIGMYGYGFLGGGEKARQLFEAREWTAVVNDNLVHNVLLVASIIIGCISGIFGVVVEEAEGFALTSFDRPIITAFVIGSILGFVLSNILLMGVIMSALNTVYVCFACGPLEFHQNHSRLSQTMRDTWSQQVWDQHPV